MNEDRPEPPPGLRVLVVDDDPLVRRGARRLLRTWAAEVTVASGGGEAVARYEQGERYDLIVLDMAMLDMDGTDTFYAVRAIDPEAAIVVTSGYPKGADVQALIDDGAVAFLDKPYRHEEVQEVLCTLLDVRCHPRPAEDHPDE
jgi:CheY-like chemotaxis protein